MQKEKQNIEFIQMLRGVAAILVVFYHGREAINGIEGGTIANILFMPGGAMGVDLFFLISGFIMVCTTWSNDGSLKSYIEFYIKRFSRVFPVYAAITILVLIIEAIAAASSYFDINFSGLIKALAFMPQGDRANGPIYGQLPLSVGWTLNYEMYFYLIFGVSLLFRRLRWIALLSIAVITLVAIPFVTRSGVSTDTYKALNYSIVYLNLITNPIIWLFIAGAGIGIAYKSTLVIPSKFWAKIAVSTAATLVVWQYLSQYRADHGIFMWGLSLVPLMLILTVASKIMKIPTHPMLVRLGDISFSLYLVHVPTKAAIQAILAFTGVPASGISFFILMVFASLIIATISHRYLEQTLSNWVRDRLLSFSNRSSKTLGATAT
ncbi:acyltransferase family protein [Collimonas sp. NPDC087041]|uniref:acyltransferase family protein n=1 Tax=Collimonas sp. NPDC087041 TaxID=3363960 RepID=UPI0037F6F59B